VNSRTLEDAIKDRSSRGKTTLISIHTPLLAADICPRAILLEAGRLEELSSWSTATLTERAKLIESRFFGRES
jgi:ABC-type multidrug transport system ATPase subunit